MRRQRAQAWSFLVGAIVLEVTGSLALKGALMVPLLYGVVAIGYTGAFGLLALVLRAGMPLGVAYGIWGASGVALTAVMSKVVFGDPLTLLMGAGICLIVGGVMCVEMGAGAARRNASVAQSGRAAS